jgi:hypothetical protein
MKGLCQFTDYWENITTVTVSPSTYAEVACPFCGWIYRGPGILHRIEQYPYGLLFQILKKIVLVPSAIYKLLIKCHITQHTCLSQILFCGVVLLYNSLKQNLHEKLIVTQLTKNFPVFYRTPNFTWPWHCIVYWVTKIQFMYSRIFYFIPVLPIYVKLYLLVSVFNSSRLKFSAFFLSDSSVLNALPFSLPLTWSRTSVY